MSKGLQRKGDKAVFGLITNLTETQAERLYNQIERFSAGYCRVVKIRDNIDDTVLADTLDSIYDAFGYANQERSDKNNEQA